VYKTKTLEKYIENISKNGLVSKEDATKYVEDLVNRYKTKQ
jgi:polyhydroxyalkanoate synthesis regulator phasin